MKRSDYCLISEGRISTVTSFYLKGVLNIPFGTKVHASILGEKYYAWKKNFDADNIPDDLWNDIQDIYLIAFSEEEKTTSELKILIDEIESRGNVRKGDYVLADPRDNPDYYLSNDEYIKKLLKKRII